MSVTEASAADPVPITATQLAALPADLRAALATPLRLSRARDTEPAIAPTDLQLPDAGPPLAEATLELSFPLPGGHGSRVTHPPYLRGRNRPRYALAPDESDELTPRAELPDPRPWCVQLIQAALEAGIGDRPVAQLLRWTSQEVYESLGRRAAPALAGPTVKRRRSTRPVVRSIHLNEPCDGVVEGCATVHDGTRARAVAIRLEGLGGRWICTALEVV